MLTEAASPVLVVGGGLGGLLLAMRLAQRGAVVHVFEKNQRFGGYNARLDDGAPLVCYKALGLEADGSLHRYMREHGIWRGAAPRRMEVCDHMVCAGGAAPLPGRFEACRDWLRDRYPGDRSGLDELFDLFARCHAAMSTVSGISAPVRRAQARAYLLEIAGERYRDRLQSRIADPGLRRLLSLRAFSSSNTTLTMAAYLGRILIDGLYHVPGSGAALVDMVVAYLERCPNVVLHRGAEVVGLLFDASHQAVGVRAGDGRTYHGAVAINIDPVAASGLMESRPAVESIFRGGVHHRPSLSALCAIFDVVPSLGRELARHGDTARFFLCDEADLFDVLEQREAGSCDLQALKVNLDSDPDGVVERVYVELDCSVDAALEPMREDPGDSPWLAGVRRRLEALHPDFADGIAATRVIAPADFARMTGNRAGAASGYSDAIDRPRLLDKAFFDHGMALVGQWSLFGSGLPQLDMGASHAYRNLRPGVARATA